MVEIVIYWMVNSVIEFQIFLLEFAKRRMKPEYLYAIPCDTQKFYSNFVVFRWGSCRFIQTETKTREPNCYVHINEQVSAVPHNLRVHVVDSKMQ